AGDALRIGHGGRAAQQRHALRRARHRQRAALLPAGRQAGLRLEPGIELGAVADQPGEVLVAAQLADQAGGMPRRAAAQPALLEQHDVLPAELGEMVGGRAAHDAAADDDDAGVGGKIVHSRPEKAAWYMRRISGTPAFTGLPTAVGSTAAISASVSSWPSV